MLHSVNGSFARRNWWSILLFFKCNCFYILSNIKKNMSLLFLWLKQLLNYHTFCDFSLTRSCKTYLRPVLPPCGRSWQLIYLNRTAHIRHQCRKTAVLNFQMCFVYTGVEKMNQHLNID